MRLDPQECRSRLRRAGHGVLATTRPDGRPHAVPVCFTLESNLVAVPHDHVKPKSNGRLQRERNLEVDGRAALLIERFDLGDWSRLWWVRADLTAVGIDADDDLRSRLEESLRHKYPQYVGERFDDVLAFVIDEITGWSAVG